MKFVVLLFSLFLSSSMMACSCFFLSFCELYNTDFQKEKVTVFLEITDTQEDGVYAVYKSATNEALIGKQFFIQSGDGANCIRPTFGIEKGQKFMSIVPYEVGDILPDTIFYSDCAENLLRIEGNSLKGMIFQADDLRVVETTFDELSTLEGCEGFQFPVEFEDFIIYPNPATNDVFIKTDKLTTALNMDVTVEAFLFSLEGKQLQYFSWETDNLETIHIPINDLPKGIYLLQIKAITSNRTFKIVKN